MHTISEWFHSGFSEEVVFNIGHNSRTSEAEGGRTNRQRQPFLLPCPFDLACRQEEWPGFRVCLSASNNVIFKIPSQGILTIC